VGQEGADRVRVNAVPVDAGWERTLTLTDPRSLAYPPVAEAIRPVNTVVLVAVASVWSGPPREARRPPARTSPTAARLRTDRRAPTAGPGRPSGLEARLDIGTPLDRSRHTAVTGASNPSYKLPADGMMLSLRMRMFRCILAC
jgi:hypothetical protein